MIKIIEQNFLAALALCLTLSYFFPGISDYLAGSISLLLALTIFFMGLNLELDDLISTVKKPKALIIGIGAQYIFMPLLACLMAKAFALPTTFAIGLMLAGSAPGGVASNIMVYLARADLPLSVAMTSLTTFLAPITMPFMIWLYAQNWVEVDFLSLLKSATEIVFIPIIVGLVFKKFFAGTTQQLNKYTPSLAIIAVCLIITIMFDLNYQRINTYDQDLVSSWSFLKLISAIVTHNLLGLIAAYYFAKLFLKDRRQLRAISIESGLQNAGLAMVLANLHFSALSAVPCMFAAIVHLILAATLASYWQKHD